MNHSSVFGRGRSEMGLEGSGEMALIGKPRPLCDSDERKISFELGAGVLDAQLAYTLANGYTKLPSESSCQMDGMHSHLRGYLCQSQGRKEMLRDHLPGALQPGRCGSRWPGVRFPSPLCQNSKGETLYGKLGSTVGLVKLTIKTRKQLRQTATIKLLRSVQRH